MKFTYNPKVFDAPDEPAAKRIILTPEGVSTDERWRRETPGLAALAGATLGLTQDSLVLDYGCGIGRLSKALIQRFGCRVIGLDISAQMRKLALDYVASSRFEALGPNELAKRNIAFDAALAVWVLQHCLSPDQDCDFIAQRLAPRGRLIVVNNYHRCVPTAERPWVNDGVDIVDLLAHKFEELERGELPAQLIGDNLAPNTFWGLYQSNRHRRHSEPGVRPDEQ